MPSLGFRVQGLVGFGVKDLGCRVQVSGFKVFGLRTSGWGVGFRGLSDVREEEPMSTQSI